MSVILIHISSLYHFISQIEAEVEVYPVPDFTKEIVGGSLGGLALLALLTAGLYKVRHNLLCVLNELFL